MRGVLEAVGVTFVLTISLFSILVFTAPNAAATLKTWTTDNDFNDPGAVFTTTEVVGTGAAAKVELLKGITDWKDLSPSASPVAREGPAAAFSSYGNRTVLFGGYNGMYLNELADTWEFDYPTNTWTMYSPSPYPIGREYGRMSYDPVQKVVVLFGGLNGSAPDTYLGDTWEYNVVSRTWTETDPAGPLMSASAMTYDAGAKMHIMVGRNYTSNLFQTWAYDASANTWTLKTTGGPVSRTGHSVSYHAQLQKTVLFGGFDDSVPPGTLLGDTWEYDYAGNTWSQIITAGPSARQAHSMTYRPASTSVLLFGGRDAGGMLQDTWRYTNARSWQMVTVSTYPPVRQHMAFTYDTNSDVAIMFGGRDPGFNQLGDTWSLEASYSSAGRYESAVFDSTCGNVDWRTLFWNKSSQPANTFLRFMLATSDAGTGPWSYVGPGGSTSAYYTMPPSAIWSGHDNHRYLRFWGDFGSFDTHATPSMEDLSIDYYCPPTPPQIVVTNPAHTARNVPLLWPINITFTEMMNPSTVTWQFLRGPSVTLVPNWSVGNTFLSLTHTQPFQEKTLYEIQVFGKDMDGNDLVAGPVPNPWMFSTISTYPVITATNPALDDANVSLTANIVVDFSEPMNQTSVKYTIDPLVTLSPGWSNGDAKLTLSHTDPFTQCTPVTVEVTNGTDKVGNPLMPDLKPNPWTFTTVCINPFITEVYPFPVMLDVKVSAPIYVNFSEPMNIGTVNWTLIRGTPVTFTPTWTDSNRRLKLTHTPNYPGCMPYEVKIGGKDVDGNVLIPGPFRNSPPNPWTFMTVCSNPFMVDTRPVNGTKDVALNTNIMIVFSEQMINSSLQLTITPSIQEIERQWDGENYMVTILHTSFTECTRYTVRVTAARSGGGLDLVPGPAPNPFVFDTICVSPYVLSTDPYHGQVLVPLNKDIIITFNEPMNPSSILFVLTPNVAGKSYSWSGGNTVLTVSHSTGFSASTTYVAFVDGTGEDGNSLLVPGPSVPNPWNFTTWSPGFYLVSTDPPDKAQNVPVSKSVVVTFSAAANRASFTAVFSPTIGWTPSWSNGDQTVTLGHAAAFVDCTDYTVTVTATDTGGSPLITVPGSAPNPWTFKTSCIPPLSPPGGLRVTRAPPGDITLSWRAVGSATSYVIYSAASKFASWPWPQLGEVPGITYTAAGHLSDGLSHFYIVRAKDATRTSANSTMGAKVPLSFPYDPAKGNIHWFSLPYRSTYAKASDISTELTSTQISVVAKWNPAQQKPMLWYFLRGKWRGNDFTISPGDGLYIGVKTSFTWIIVGTDGSVTLSFSLNPPSRGNVDWISLPYTSTYAYASDIVKHIEGSIGPSANTKITEVARWDPATQTMIRYAWTVTGWSGTDFTIGPGDGIYLKIVADFTWTPNLITPEVP